jgi:hypothetical protein
MVGSISYSMSVELVHLSHTSTLPARAIDPGH